MKILVIIAHPTMDDSRINAYLKKVVEQEASITVHDLYSTYPNEDIDVGQEQQLLEKHDRIVFQYPNYWYSYTPLLKKWFDKVLESGWAFKGNRALKGKEFGVALSSAFKEEDYRFDGIHRHSIDQILAPFHATCNFIRVKSLPAFHTFEENVIFEEALIQQGERYLRYVNGSYEFHYFVE